MLEGEMPQGRRLGRQANLSDTFDAIAASAADAVKALVLGSQAADTCRRCKRPVLRITFTRKSLSIHANEILRRLTSLLDITASAFYTAMESLLDMGSDIRNRVKELRLARGWTQEQLAQAVGVSRQSINSIERERYVPSLPLALMFARIFKCPTDEIFTLEKRSP